MDVAANPTEAGPVLSILHERVSEVSEEEGTLCLSFANGARLVCPPDPDEESWIVSLPNELIVCPPASKVR